MDIEKYTVQHLFEPLKIKKFVWTKEKNGLISREIFATVPPTVEYRTTELGQTLKPLIYEIKKWGIQHMRQVEGQ